jgi:hypothetical protein
VTGEPTGRDRDERIKADVDPEAFLRALLRLSPEDAADVRRIAAERTAKRQEDTDGSAD